MTKADECSSRGMPTLAENNSALKPSMNSNNTNSNTAHTPPSSGGPGATSSHPENERSISTNTNERKDTPSTVAYRKPTYGGPTGNGSSFTMEPKAYQKALSKEKKYVRIGQKILDLAKVKINGDRPFDMRVHNPAVLQRVIQKGSLGLGEAYMEGWWDTQDFHSLHIFFERILRGGIEYYFPNNAKDVANILRARIFNPQTKKRSKKVGLMHYDLGNAFFEAMLGRYMQYSCGYWVEHKHVSTLTDDDRKKILAQWRHRERNSEEKDGFVTCRSNNETCYHADAAPAGSDEASDSAGKPDANGMVAVPITNLEEAQVAKLRMIGEKLRLRPGMEVLDVGCGWGGLALFLAEEYKVKVVGITISEEQKKDAERMTQSHRDDITILITDYRDIQTYYEREKKLKNKKFDRIVSVGMFEHVGPKNYKKFFEVMRSLLNDKDDEAVMLLHTIGSKQTMESADQWYLKYIFPGGCLPAVTNIGKSIESVFVVEDMHSFGYFYALTLLAWRERFLAYWEAQRAMPANVKRKHIETSRAKKSSEKATGGSSNAPDFNADEDLTSVSNHRHTNNNSGSGSDSPSGSSAEAQAQGDREAFFRMFYYYLSSSAGAFMARDLQLWQFVLSPNGVRGYPDVPRP